MKTRIPKLFKSAEPTAEKVKSSRPQINDRVALLNEEISSGKGKIGIIAAVYGHTGIGPCIVGVDWDPENNPEGFKVLDTMYPNKLKRIR